MATLIDHLDGAFGFQYIWLWVCYISTNITKPSTGNSNAVCDSSSFLGSQHQSHLSVCQSVGEQNHVRNLSLPQNDFCLDFFLLILQLFPFILLIFIPNICMYVNLLLQLFYVYEHLLFLGLKRVCTWRNTSSSVFKIRWWAWDDGEAENSLCNVAWTEQNWLL